MDYDLKEFPKEEGDALTKEIQAVLEKYNGEIGVTTNIHLWKRVPKEGIPFKMENVDSTPKETGESASG